MEAAGYQTAGFVDPEAVGNYFVGSHSYWPVDLSVHQVVDNWYLD